ncbi:MAG TPA: alpha/beta fold hydrolase [Acidimicrobiia bacterium]
MTGAIVTCDVSPVVPLDGEHVMSGWVYAPLVIDPSSPPTVVFCLAGGRCTTSYFDLEVRGHEGYSMARHLAGRGLVVVALDHLGLGASSPLQDICVVTPHVAAATHDHAVRDIADRLRAGTIVDGLPAFAPHALVGLGHSMGGMVIVVEQAEHRTFDAIVVLGHSGDGTWEALTDDERLLMEVPREDREQAMADLARVRARGLPPETARRAAPGSFFNADVPRAVKGAFGAQRTELLYSCALSTMIPGHTDTEKAAVTVPVFLAFGDHDLTDDYDGNAARYPSSPDVTLVVLRDSAHCHNQATTRAELWDRVGEWITSVSPAASA